MEFDPKKKDNLIIIDKTEVRKYWHLIRPGLEYLSKERPPADKWIPEEIYTALVNGNATLAFTSIMRGEDKGFRYTTREAAIKDSSGFVVLQKVGNFVESALHIWIAVSNDATKKADAGSIMRVFNDDLNTLAKNAGYQAITFSSNLDFWETIGPRFGFEKVDVKYRKAVK
jgi:predicted GNAT superfamily acetyltransferase